MKISNQKYSFRKCACGCNGTVKTLGSMFRQGHSARVGHYKDEIKKKMSILRAKYFRKCACGCERIVKTPGGTFLRGHISKIEHPLFGPNRDEICRKISMMQKGKVIPFSQRKQISETLTGRKLSSEHIEKIRQNTIKNNPAKSNSARKKISDALKGREITKNWRDKISQTLKGRVPTQGYLDNLRLAMALKHSGPLHHNWQGGISFEPYCVNWTYDLKEMVKERDSYQCQSPKCWETSEDLVVHHINYNKKDCEPNNLITLCNSCNLRANKNRHSWEKLFSKLILKMPPKISFLRKLKTLNMIPEGALYASTNR